MNMFRCTCTQCNAPIEIDLDDLKAFCPYCGTKIMVDIDQVSMILTERERTKQIEIMQQAETERTRIKETKFERNLNAWERYIDKQWEVAFQMMKVAGVFLSVFVVIAILVKFFS